MVRIQVEFECTAPKGECQYQHVHPNVCIEDIGGKSMWVCDKLKATRKKEKASQKSEVK
jgi:hypothetical protein